MRYTFRIYRDLFYPGPVQFDTEEREFADDEAARAYANERCANSSHIDRIDWSKAE